MDTVKQKEADFFTYDVQNAQMILSHLKNGEPPPLGANLADAAKIFLTRNAESAIEAVQENLKAVEIIYQSMPDSAEKGQLLGTLMVGSSEERGLAHDMVKELSGTHFEDHEKTLIQNVLSESPERILQALAHLLPRTESAPERSKKDSKSRTSDPALRTRIELESRREDEDEDNNEDTRFVSREEKLFDHAVAKGKAGFIDLANEAIGNSNETDWIVPAFLKIASEHSADKDAILQASMLEINPQTRTLGKFLRSVLSGENPTAKTNNNQKSQEDMPSQGWLSRALASCDKVSLLKASSGMESMAIPMVMGEIIRQRCAKVSQKV
jgi:hypothetical protein